MGAYQRDLRRIDLAALAAGKTPIVVGSQLGAGTGSIRVWQIELTSSAATVLTPFSRTIPGGVDTQSGAAISFPVANATVTLEQSEQPWIEILPGQTFVLQSSNAATMTGSIWYSLA